MNAEEMKRRIQTVAVLIIAGVLGTGCDRQTDASKTDSPPGRSIESPDPFAAVEEEGPKDQKIPATLDEALDLMMTGLTDKDRKFIEDADGQRPHKFNHNNETLTPRQGLTLAKKSNGSL